MSLQNLIIHAARQTAANAQVMAAFRTFDIAALEVEGGNRVDKIIDALVATRKDIERTTVTNDRRYETDLTDYTVVIANEPDCDGQTYSVTIIRAPSAPFAVTLAEIRANEMAVACYAGNHKDEAEAEWAPRWNPWVHDDTLGTVLDHTMEDDVSSVYDHPEW